MLTQKWRLNGTGVQSVSDPCLETAAHIHFAPLYIFQEHGEKLWWLCTDVGRTAEHQSAFTTTGRSRGRAGQRGAFGGKREKKGQRDKEMNVSWECITLQKNIYT